MFFKGVTGMLYTDRGDIAAFDYSLGDLTIDSSYHDLDVSGIVGVGQRLVKLRVRTKENAGNKRFALRTKGNSNEYNVEEIWTQVANVENEVELWVWTNANGVIQYKGYAATWSLIYITVLGWFK